MFVNQKQFYLVHLTLVVRFIPNIFGNITSLNYLGTNVSTSTCRRFMLARTSGSTRAVTVIALHF